MKLNHNKKRNTAFIYEMLIKELSKASMYNDVNKKNLVLSIIREAFAGNKLMKRELDIYKSFESIEKLDNDLTEKLLSESKKQFMRLNRKDVFDEQTKVISRINKDLGHDVWNTFIPEFKKVATINQVLNQSLSPKKQVLLEKKLLSSPAAEKKENKPFPNVNNLAMKTFIDKFNKQYSESLAENQKMLLNKYISSYQDSGIGLKTYLYEEIDRIKEEFYIYSQQNNSKTSQKVARLLERIQGYNKRKIDKDFVIEIMRMQTIIEEIKS
jgi:hypothetical protein